MSKSWANGSTRAWRQTRAAVLARDGYVCRLQIPLICKHTATQVHHVKGRKVTCDDPAYLVAACGPCNRRIGDPTKATQQISVNGRQTTKW